MLRSATEDSPPTHDSAAMQGMGDRVGEHRGVVPLLVHLQGPLVLLLILVLFYWRIVISGQFELMWTPDLANQVLPWLQTAAREWNQHRSFPLWDPHLWSGQPMIGQAQPGIAYPLNWLLFALPQREGYFLGDVVDFYFLVIHYMAALFFYWMMRDQGCSRPAAVFGGLAFTTTAYLGATVWPQLLNGAVWTPLIFLFLLRVQRSVRPLESAAFSGFSLGMAWLSGHHNAPIVTTLAVGILWLFLLIRDGRSMARLAATSAVVCVLVSALQVLPAIEYGGHAKRWVNGPEAVGWHDAVPFPVHQALSVLPSDLPSIALLGYGARDPKPFVGLTVLTLAAFALIGWRSKGAHVWCFAVLGAGSLLYMLGGDGFIEGVLYSVVPLVEKARSPSVAVLLFGLAACALAATGFDSIRSAPLGRWAAGLAAAAAVIFTCTSVLYLAKFSPDPRISLTGLCALILAGCLAASRSGFLTPVQTGWCLTLILLVETNASHFPPAHRTNSNNMKHLAAIQSNRDIAAWLRQQPDGLRVDATLAGLNANWPAYHGIDAIHGYLPSLTANHVRYASHTPQAKRLFGTHFYLASEPLQADMEEAFSGQSGVKVFRDPHAFARAWLVHELEAVAAPELIAAAIEQDVESFRFKARLLGSSKAPRLEQCGPAEPVVYHRVNAGQIVVRTSARCTAMLVISETYFPGWSATVDGTPAAIHEVNGAMRGVVVPSGAHIVTMRYRPASVTAGAGFTALGLLIGLGAVYVERRRETRHQRQTPAQTLS